MITVLRIISQVCQCFEDQSKYDLTEQEKSSIPLYLRKGQRQDYKDEFIKTLESLSSKRSSITSKPLIQTKRTSQGQNPDVYEFPPQSPDPDKKDILKASTPDTEGENEDRNHMNIINLDEPNVNLTTIRSNQRGRAASLIMVKGENAQQQEEEDIEEIREEEEKDNHSHQDNQDNQDNHKDKKVDDAFDFQLEGEQQKKNQEQEDFKRQKEEEDKEFDYFMVNLHPKQHKPKLKELDLETRVKNKRLKKRKKKTEEIDSGKSPYRVNFPKELTTMALHIKEKEYQREHE